MSLAAHADFETRSVADLTKVGVDQYMRHPTTGIWMLSWRIGNSGPINRWHPGDPVPWPLVRHVAAGGYMSMKAHNQAFERLAWNILMRRYIGEEVELVLGFFPICTIEMMDCTMARAMALAFPGQLEKVAAIVAPDVPKDMEGNALMKRMMRPRRTEKDGRLVWWDEPERVERLGAYCDQDVEAETAIDLRLAALTPRERHLFERAEHVNDRGIKLDRQLVLRAQELVGVATIKANRRMKELTGGVVKTVGQTAKIVEFLRARNVPCSSMKKGDHDELITYSDLVGDPVAKAVVELRRDGYKSSTAKFPAMLRCASELDDRMRRLLVYHGASTGRKAGRLIQPQNFPRVDPDRDLPTVLTIIKLLLSREPVEVVHDILEAIYGEVMPWMAKLLRACLIAEDGKEFIGGDLSNIEGRVNAWMGGEQWKLMAFLAYDQGLGPDLYKLAYSRAFGVDVDAVDKIMRQIGKVMELALGYQGSVGAFLSMVNTYQIKLADIVEVVLATTGRNQLDATAGKFTKAQSFGLPEHWWVALKVVVDNWRLANPAIVQSWWDRQDAAIDAVANPGQLITLCGGRLAYMSTGKVLLARGPSGKILNYWNPRIIEQPATIEVLDEDGDVLDVLPEDDALAMPDGTILGRRKHGKRSVAFDGTNSKTKKWGTRFMYGGFQCENDVQMTSREVIFEAADRIEAAGYTLVLDVHDELLSENPEGFGSPEEFERLMSVNPAWLPGCPLAAAAWRDVRYTK